VIVLNKGHLLANQFSEPVLIKALEEESPIIAKDLGFDY
jgi:hypothetical protein